LPLLPPYLSVTVFPYSGNNHPWGNKHDELFFDLLATVRVISRLIADGSLQMAFVICIFLALIFKPERIVRPLMFRIACLLFVLTLLTPILQVVITTMTGPPGDLGRPATGAISGYLMALINPAVFSAAFLSAVGSMTGKQPVQSADSE